MTLENLPEPLCNIEAEQALLGALLMKNDLLHKVSFLNATDFFEPLHIAVFEVAVRQINNGEKVDPITLSADPGLKEVPKTYLAKLAAHSVIVLDAVAYAKQIKRLALQRELQTLFQTALDAISGQEPHETAAKVTAALHKLSEVDFGNPAKSDAKVTQEILADIQRDLKPHRTGIPKLDEAMDGGMYPGKAYGFSARKKIGKTILAATVSFNLAKENVKHLFICAEMSPQEIHQRQLARELQVYPSAFRSDYRNSQDFQAKLAGAMRNSKRNIIYQNAPGLTFDQLKSYVSRAVNNHGITGFILDYWQLVGGKQGKQSDAAHLDEVAQWIANTCRQYDLWAFVTAQINQEGNTRGGEGIRLAFDQVYQLSAPEDDPSRSGRYLEMMDTRYTKWMSIGNEDSPGLSMNEHGPYFEQRT